MNSSLPIKIICASLLLFNSVHAQAGDGACSTASFINPNTIDGGMGGTGAPANGGLGGTGIDAEHGGLGGTGAVAANTTLLPNDTEGGIAIVGVVTGFASICVNDEEVFYDKNTPVYDNGIAVKLSSLATGKMVMLKADKVGGQLRARSIGLFDAVAGPVGRVDAKLNQMQVMGQTVRLNQNMMQQVKDLGPNASVRVSGHRLNSGEIVATRVDVGKAGSASTLGLVTGVASDNVLVNGTRVHIENKNTLGKIKVGSEVRVNGQWDGSAIKAELVQSQPIKNSINRAETAIIEGFVKTGRENTMRIGGTEIEASQGSATYNSVEQSRGKVVKIEMRRDKKGAWVCDKVEERSGKLFERHRSVDSNSDDNLSSDSENSSETSSGGDNSGSGANSESGSDNSGSDANSGSGSVSSGSGSNSGSGSSSGGGHSSSSSSSGSGSSSGGHGSSSGSGSGHGSSSSSGGGRSSGSSSGGSGRVSSGGSSGGGSSSSGLSGLSGLSGSGRGSGGKGK